MRALTKWLALATAIILLGCETPPEMEAPEREPVTAAEPQRVTEPPEDQPTAEEPKEEEAKPEGAAEAEPHEMPVVSASNVWAQGKEGKLLLGLDGGLYEPYRVSLIEEVQRALQAQGLYSGEAHGYLDEETMKALGEFQKQNGLKVSGVPTSRTRKALLAVGASGAT